MILLPLKEKRREQALAAGRLPLVGGAERLGGVLDQQDVVALADLGQGVVVATLAVQVDGDARRERGRPGGDDP